MVTDFGIARLAADAEAARPGTTLGSVHYFSPEQAAGATTTPASDVYGLGLVLYETLTGDAGLQRRHDRCDRARPDRRGRALAAGRSARRSRPELDARRPSSVGARARRSLCERQRDGGRTRGSDRGAADDTSVTTIVAHARRCRGAAAAGGPRRAAGAWRGRPGPSLRHAPASPVRDAPRTRSSSPSSPCSASSVARSRSPPSREAAPRSFRRRPPTRRRSRRRPGPRSRARPRRRRPHHPDAQAHARPQRRPDARRGG